jgi:hypothetical protein
MKIALDIHGVVDSNHTFFAELTQLLVNNDHEVHLLTGSKITKELKQTLAEYCINWTHLFSITDYHVKKKSGIKFDKNGHPWLDAYKWDKTKAEYCARNNIDLCLDDSDTYAYFFKTPYARYYSRNSTRIRKMHI